MAAEPLLGISVQGLARFVEHDAPARNEKQSPDKRGANRDSEYFSRMRDVFAGYNAYFGTFEIDESTRTVIDHVDASLVPSWVGGDQRRTFSFSGHNRLTLTAVRQQAMNTLIWEGEGV